MAASGALEFSNVCVRFSKQKGARESDLHLAVNDVTFNVPSNGFVSVIGPSGCGKSTLLNIAAGLIQPSSGSVGYAGEAIAGVDRRIGYVTQDANLLPWLSVIDNVALPLKFLGVDKKERLARAHDWLERVGLDQFSKFYPGQLSGGMQKRCSIARTFIYGPEVLLMDEPFGPLDAMTRVVLQQELLNLWEHDQKTVMFVTHDLAEAIALSDQIIVMSRAPGSIKSVVSIPLSRPRDVGRISEQPQFGEIHSQIWHMFTDELGISNADAKEVQIGVRTAADTV